MPTELARVLPDTNVCYPISLLDLRRAATSKLRQERAGLKKFA